MRDLLDPVNGYNIELPKDKQLKDELTTATYALRAMKVYVMQRDEFVKKLGRSPDRATAYCLAAMDTKKRKVRNIEPEREEVVMWELA